MHGEKVAFYKTWWFWAVIILFIYGFVSGISGSDEEESEETTQTEEITQAESDYIDEFVYDEIIVPAWPLS